MMKQEIEKLLQNITKILKTKNNFFIVSNRTKNNTFCQEYSLSSKHIKKIIANLNINDFNKVLNNLNKDYKEEKLYVFAPIIELVNSYGKKEKIQLYLKINFIEHLNTIIIISLHKSVHQLKYAFK